MRLSLARAPALALALVASLLVAGCVKEAPAAAPVEPAAANESASSSSISTPSSPSVPQANATPNASAAPHVALVVTLEGLYPATSHFTLDKTEIPAGATIDLTFKNEDLNPLGNHDWVLQGVDGAKTKQIDTGTEDHVTFTAPAPGEYTYVCSVPTHSDHGLMGKLKVV